MLFPKISGSEAKSQLILYRTRFGTGPEGRLRTKSDLARFQKFRIISTPRSGVPVLVFASSKTHGQLSGNGSSLSRIKEKSGSLTVPGSSLPVPGLGSPPGPLESDEIWTCHDDTKCRHVAQVGLSSELGHFDYRGLLRTVENHVKS